MLRHTSPYFTVLYRTSTYLDYRWWWRSLLTSGSTALYVFLYSIGRLDRIFCVCMSRNMDSQKNVLCAVSALSVCAPQLLWWCLKSPRLSSTSSRSTSCAPTDPLQTLYKLSTAISWDTLVRVGEVLLSCAPLLSYLLPLSLSLISLSYLPFLFPSLTSQSYNLLLFPSLTSFSYLPLLLLSPSLLSLSLCHLICHAHERINVIPTVPHPAFPPFLPVPFSMTSLTLSLNPFFASFPSLSLSLFRSFKGQHVRYVLTLLRIHGRYQHWDLPHHR